MQLNLWIMTLSMFNSPDDRLVWTPISIYQKVELVYTDHAKVCQLKVFLVKILPQSRFCEKKPKIIGKIFLLAIRNIDKILVEFSIFLLITFGISGIILYTNNVNERYTNTTESNPMEAIQTIIENVQKRFTLKICGLGDMKGNIINKLNCYPCKEEENVTPSS